jgi:hypothetical protein
MFRRIRAVPANGLAPRYSPEPVVFFLSMSAQARDADGDHVGCAPESRTSTIPSSTWTATSSAALKATVPMPLVFRMPLMFSLTPSPVMTCFFRRRRTS